MAREINLRIVIENTVDGAIYGLQKGKGPNYETVQMQPGNSQDLTFDFTVHVKEVNGSLPAIAGPFVQGPTGNRFFYIIIGSYARQPSASWGGRMKVPLSEATFQNMLSNEASSNWSCTVPGRNNDGKPVYATVKPFAGWFVGSSPTK